MAPPQGGLLNIPTDAGNTPASAAVTSMQQGGNPGPPLPPQQGPSPPPPQPVPPSPAPLATAGQDQQQQPQSSGNWLIDAAQTMAGSLASFGSSTLNALPVIGPGLTTISQAGEAGINSLIGSGPTSMAGVAQQQNALRQQYPLPSLTGTVAGTVGPALLPGVGAAVGGAVAGDVASAGMNLGRAVLLGGSTAAADTAARGGSLADDAMSGVAGAVAGPVVGKVAGFVAPYVGNAVRGATSIARQLAGDTAPAASAASRRAWAYVASKLGVSADDMAKFVAQRKADTGQAPTLQEVMQAHSAGGIKNLANSNPETAMALQEGQRASQAALPAQAAATVEAAGIPAPKPAFLKNVPAAAQSPTQANPIHPLVAARDAGMKAAMAPINATPVDLSLEPLLKKKVYTQLPDEAQKLVRAAAKSAGDLADATVSIPLEHVDVMRRTFRSLQQTPKNRALFRGLANDVGEAATAQVPAYGKALNDFADADNYILGFAHAGAPGAVGSDVAAAQQRALETPHGLAGHRAGVMTTLRDQANRSPAAATAALNDMAGEGTANRTIATIAGQPAADTAQLRAKALLAGQRSATASTPSAIQPADEGSNTRNLLAATAEGAAGLHLSAAGRASRVISDFITRAKLPPALQREVGKAFTSRDPAVVAATLDKLRAANVSEADLKNLQAAFSILGGGMASGVITTGGDQSAGAAP